jgi:subtilisin family serine protease
MAVKFLDAQGGGSLANAIKAIDYARKNGAKIMSNSWGGGGSSDLMKTAIVAARDAGSLFIAAAGNDGANNDSNPTYPASYVVDNIVSVAAINNRGTLADFSNYGAKTVHLAAPGVNILSTAPAAIDASGFQTLSGTSMATPHVSGVAALVLSHQPNLTYKELKDRLVRSARPLAGLRGKVASGGMLDAYLAVTGQMAPPDSNDPANWTQSTAFSAATPHPYLPKSSLTFTASVPGAKKIAVHFAKFQTEANYDFVEFFDKTGKSLGKLSGKMDGTFSPAADGDTMTMKFTSDDSVNDYGIDADSISYQQ